MEKSFLLRKGLFCLLLFALIFPIAFVSFQSPLFNFEWDPFFGKVMRGASLQAVLSTTLTLLLGGVASFGLFGLASNVRSRNFQVLQFLLLLPGFIPPLLVVTLSVRVFRFLPSGLWAVVFFHVLMNVGLAAVIFYRLIRNQALSWVEFAMLAGVRRTKFIFLVLIRELKGDILAMAFYFFVLYFFSFSIPFLVGGTSFGGIEVFLYEKVVLFGEWGQAGAYSLILFAMMFLITILLKEPISWNSGYGSEREVAQGYLGNRLLNLISFLPLVFMFIGLLLATPFLKDWDFSLYSQAIRGTLLVGLSVGMMVFLLLSLLTFCYLRGWFAKVLLAFVHPGWVVMGFAFLLMPGQSTLLAFLKITIALTLLYLPYLYRLDFHESLQSLQGQVATTANFPVSWGRVFYKILFPQVLPNLCLLSGLAGLWACGDFAITGFFVETSQVQTLAFQMKDLLSHYRSEQAVIFLWPLLVCGGLVFFVFQGLSYVSGQKIKS